MSDLEEFRRETRAWLEASWREFQGEPPITPPGPRPVGRPRQACPGTPRPSSRRVAV